jgi:hypothetical protein
MGKVILSVLAVCCLSAAVLAQEIIKETIDENGQAWYGPIRKCPTGADFDLDSCIDQIVTDLTPRIAKGIPELGLKPLDPFNLDHWSYDEKFGPITVNIKAKGIKLEGITQFSAMNLKVDKKNGQINFEFKVPRVAMEGTYKLGGSLPFVRGYGPSNIETFNIAVKGHMPLTTTTRPDGTKVIQIKKTQIDDMTIGKMNFRVGGLFNGNPILSAPIHFIANQYGAEVFELFAKGPITKTIDEIITNDIVNPILTRLPYLTQYLN